MRVRVASSLAVGEALVVIPFGFTPYSALVVVGIGTLFHHSADAVIALALHGALSKTGVKFTRAAQLPAK